MSKVPLVNYTVKYLVREIVEVNVRAKDEEEAREFAKLVLSNDNHTHSMLTVVDGNSEYIGIDNQDKWTEFYGN